MISVFWFALSSPPPSPAESPLTWLTSLGAFLPAAAVLWYLVTDARKERDRYRELVFEMLPQTRDALMKAALAQEQLAEAVEERLLSHAEIVRLRKIVERQERRAEGEG